MIRPPAPTVPCRLLSRDELARLLAQPTQDGKRQLEPLKTWSKEQNAPFNVLEDQAVSNDAEVHTHEDDLWVCLEGEVSFIYGGEMVDPKAKTLMNGTVDEREWKSKTLVGGTDITLHPGDWLWIPAGQPHQHRCATTARLMIIKIPTKVGT